MSTAPGVGVDLRTATKKDGSKLVDCGVEHQVAICNTPFDAIMDKDASIIEFMGTYCGPCLRLIPTLMKHAITYKNISILQISSEEPAKMKKLYQGVKCPYSVSTVTRDLWEDLSELVQLRGIPHLILLRKGVPVFSGHPMEPELEPLLKKINAEVEAEKKAAVAAAATTAETKTETETAQ